MTKIALGQVIQINPSSIRSDFHYDEIEYLDISSVGTGSYSGTKTLQTVSAPSRAKRLVQNKDTILATVRPNLRSFALIKKPPANLVVSTGFAVLHSTELIDPIFLYYSVTDQTFTDYLAANVKGAAYPAVDTEIIARGEIFYPPRDVQRKIADVLSAYDDLIEVNTRRIRILEQMAQAVYHEWFGKVDAQSLPEGWEFTTVESAFETIGGSTPSTKNPEYWEGGDITWYSPSDLTANKAMFIKSSAKQITHKGLENSSAKMFPPYCVMMTSRATIGVVSINTTPACTNQGFITCIPNERVSTFQIYFWILDNLELIDGIASGATYKEIGRGEFREFDFVIPDRDTKQKFDKVMIPIGQQIEVLLAKNANLRRTRDLLLPRLVSGEVTVKGLENVGA